MFALRWVVRRIGEFRGYRQRRPSAYCSLVALITELWSDGACSGNPGPGGWAYILIARRPDGSVAKKLEGHGGEE